MKVLVCGSREWLYRLPIERELKKLLPGTILIHGGANGADSLAGEIGETLGFEVRCYRADWGRLGRRAGPIRNSEMLKKEHRPEEPIDLVLAFTKYLDGSKGTKDMVMKSRAAGLQVTVFSV